MRKIVGFVLCLVCYGCSSPNPFYEADLGQSGSLDSSQAKDGASGGDGGSAVDLSKEDGGSRDDQGSSADLTGSTDLALGADLGFSPDLRSSVDLAFTPDLSRSADLALAPDFATRPDLATPPDLRPAVDLVVTPDLAQKLDVHVTMAVAPGSSTHVLKATAKSFGIVISPATMDVDFAGIKIVRRGTAKTDGIVLAKLLLGNQLLAQAVPDIKTNSFTFTGFQPIRIFKGTSITLILEVVYGSGDSTIGTHIFDVVDPESIAFVQKVKVGTFPLNPDNVVITLARSGVVTIHLGNQRAVTILVGGGDVWQRMNDIKACAFYEPAIIDYAGLDAWAQKFGFDAVGVGLNGVAQGSRVVAFGKSHVDVNLNGQIPIPQDQCINFQLWAKLSNVQASSNDNGTHMIPYTGEKLRLGLLAGHVGGEWDQNYAKAYNLRITGAASGQRIYAEANAGTLYNPPLGVEPFTLRKTKPTVTRHAVGGTLLVGADVDLAKIQISADPAGPLTVKKMSFNLIPSLVQNGRILLSNFRLRKGNFDIQPGLTKIIDCNGNDLVAGAWDTAQNACSMVSVTLVNEDTLFGSGAVYTLHATVGAARTNDTLVVQLVHPAKTAVTGKLTGSMMVGGKLYAAPNLLVGGVAVPAGFVWSDQAEIPHGEFSNDWTDEFQVEDFSGSWVLVR